MGHRLSKITTRTGDAGETGLGDGARVAKDSARIAALGDIDELNSAIGVVLAEEVPAEAESRARAGAARPLRPRRRDVHSRAHRCLTEKQVQDLETQLERWNAELAAAQGVHPSRRQPRRRGGAPRAHGLPARRAHPGRARPRASRWATRAALPQPAVRPAVRRRPRPQSRGRSRGDVQWRHKRKP